MKNKLLALTLSSLFITLTIAQTKNATFLHKEKQNQVTKFGKASSKSLPQNSTRWNWNEISTSWEDPNSTMITYDNVGNPIMETTEYYYNGGQDTSRSRSYHTFNNKNLNTATYSLSWNPNTSQWDSTWKNITTYDVNGNSTSNEGYNYNQSTSSWTLSYGYKSTYTYDANNRIMSNIELDWIDHLSAYRNSSKSEFSYNAQGVITELTTSEWDTISSTFKLDGKITNIVWHAYDVNDLDNSKIGSWVMQGWNGTSFNDSSRIAITYDTHDNEIRMLGENKSGSNWILDYEIKMQLTYNVSDQLTEKIEQHRDDINDSMMNLSKEVYSNFLVFSGLQNTIAKEVAVSIYPNPITTSATIHVESKNTNGQFKLYNITGTEVYRTSITNSNTEFEKGSIPQGIYFYQVITNNNTVSTGKLIIQ